MTKSLHYHGLTVKGRIKERNNFQVIDLSHATKIRRTTIYVIVFIEIAIGGQTSWNSIKTKKVL